MELNKVRAKILDMKVDYNKGAAILSVKFSYKKKYWVKPLMLKINPEAEIVTFETFRKKLQAIVKEAKSLDFAFNELDAKKNIYFDVFPKE